jgi:hypothetical protein
VVSNHYRDLIAQTGFSLPNPFTFGQIRSTF